VHRWLDEFAGQPPHSMRHSQPRPHLAGLEQARFQEHGFILRQGWATLEMTGIS
jgi:hypothetical protein